MASEAEPERTVTMHQADGTWSNAIRTCKYTLLTFVPKNLFEQFHIGTNVYFLICGGLQLFPEITTSGGLPMVWVPLFSLMALASLKDLAEDLTRRKNDKSVNNAQARGFDGRQFRDTQWKDVQVGYTS